jgi:hypothetical protein
VVILPLDVQVSEAEWAKYGTEKVPMAETELLNQDAVLTAKMLGMKALSPMQELRAALPDAFLNKDLHLTAKGNQAVALAISIALKSPPALPLPKGGLPEGLKRAPSPEALAVEAVVPGSSAAHCRTFYRDGWFRALCATYDGHVPLGVFWNSSPPPESYLFESAGQLSVLVQLPPGRSLAGTLIWNDEERSLDGTWPSADGEPEFKIGARTPRTHKPRPLASIPPESEICSCAKAAYDARMVRRTQGIHKDYIVDPPPPYRCEMEVFTADSECVAAYRGDCSALLACLNGDPWFTPPCGEEKAAAGAIERCRPLCGPDVPCPSGMSCLPWQGTAVCFPNPSED